MSEIKIRGLKGKDAKFLAKMYTKVSKKVDFVAMGESESESAGMKLFQVLFEDHLDEIWDWMADVAGMTPEELDDAPVSAPKDIITQVMECEEVKGFFSKAQV